MIKDNYSEKIIYTYSVAKNHLLRVSQLPK